jgi:hypothetical protein
MQLLLANGDSREPTAAGDSDDCDVKTRPVIILPVRIRFWTAAGNKLQAATD